MPRLIGNPPEMRIGFEERRVLVRLGHEGRLKNADVRLRAVIGEEMDRALRLIRPRLAAVVLEAEELPDEAVFKKAKKAALCICTIGPELERECADLMSEGEILRGFVLDGLGSEAVTGIARQAVSWLAQEGRDMGLRPGKPFAPGTIGWDVAGQVFIFRAIPAESIGVKLSELFMMSPRKSYSFRINYSEHG